MVNNDNENYTFFWTPGRIFNPFLAFEISQPVPQHEAIIVQTNGKMILTDQLIIEDRNEERGAKDESADSLTVIACLNQTIENTL